MENNNSQFDQMDYIKQWKKKNMKSITVSYTNSFVTEFKEACNTLGLKQSDIFRDAMQSVIDQAKQKA